MNLGTVVFVAILVVLLLGMLFGLCQIVFLLRAVNLNNRGLNLLRSIKDLPGHDLLARSRIWDELADIGEQESKSWWIFGFKQGRIEQAAAAETSRQMARDCRVMVGRLGGDE